MVPANDIVIFGATGFCGRQVLAYLVPLLIRARLKWAVAGRQVAALEQLAGAMPAAVAPAVIVADANDPATLSGMAAQSRVLINLVGPYERNGAHAVVRACLESGADYVDLSAETSLHRQLIDDFHAPASAAGRRIVPACGFLSAPFDLGLHYANTLLLARCGSPLRTAEAVLHYRPLTGQLTLRNAFSGGTVATLLDVVERSRIDGLTDPGFLAPDATNAQRRAHSPIAIDSRVDLETGALCVAMFPTPFITPQVVHRTNHLLEAIPGSAYSPALTYTESVALESLFPDPMLRAAARLQFNNYHRLLRDYLDRRTGFAAGASRALLKSLSSTPGSGPSDVALDSLDYTIELRARAMSGQLLNLLIDGRGHPGYRSSANIVAECALLLAGLHGTLPPIHGVLTPAAAFGGAALAPMARAGLRFNEQRATSN